MEIMVTLILLMGGRGIWLEKEEYIRLIDQNNNQIEELLDRKVEIWQEYVLFSPTWYLGIALSIIPWLLWYKYRKKTSTNRLLYAGFFVMTVSLVLDVLGDQMGFWHYRFNVVPLLPTYFPWDITLQPVAVLFLLQTKPSVSPIMKGIVFALLTSFVAEPIFDWAKLYNPITWEYYYSVPIQFAIYLTADFISNQNTFMKLKDNP